VCRHHYCFASVSGVRSSPCFAGPYPNTTDAPPKDGTEVPKQHSKCIRAASAATASGSLETALSKLTRRSTVASSSSSLRRVTSDRVLTFRANVRVGDYTARWFRAGGTRTVRSMRPKSSPDFCNWILQHRRSQQQGCGEPLRAFNFTLEIGNTPNPLLTDSAPTMQKLSKMHP
jgi:hypothetical protein